MRSSASITPRICLSVRPADSPGLSADLGNAAHAIFVANIGSESVTKYLNGRKVPRELTVISGAPEIEGVQSLAREAFKFHVGRRDSGLRI